MADGDTKKPTDEELPDFIDTDGEGDEDEEAEGSDEAEATEDDASEGNGDAVAAAPDDEVEEADTAPPDTKSTSKKGKKKGKTASASKPTKAVASKAAPTASGDDGGNGLLVEPDDDGIFKVGPNPPHWGDDIDDHFMPRVRSKLAFGVLALVLVGIVGGLLFVMSNEALSNDLRCFLDGEIEECKTAEKKRLLAKWREEDRKAANKYADLTLTYFPQNARVKITKVRYVQDGLNGLPKKDSQEDVANKSQDLKDNENVERIPLQNLAVFESVKNEATGEVDKVYTYEYQFEFSRQGYKPKSLTIRPDDWMQVGPGNLAFEWPGLDLEPEIETVKENMKKAVSDLFCLMKIKGLEWDGVNFEQVPTDNYEIIRKRHQFKDEATFVAFHSALRAGEHAEWWAATWAEVSAQKCEE